MKNGLSITRSAPLPTTTVPEHRLMFPSTSRLGKLSGGARGVIDENNAGHGGSDRNGNPGAADGDFAELDTQADF